MRKQGPLVLVGVVGLIAAAVVLLNGGRFPWSGEDLSVPPKDPCGIPKSVATDPRPAAPGVRIAEQGLTSGDNGQLSLGVVVENTSDQVAYRTRISYHLFDARRSPIAKTMPDTVIPVIMPGERVGTGFSDLQDQPKASTFEVDLGRTTWLPLDALGGLTPVTATYLRTWPSPPGTPPLISVDYHEMSNNCRALYPENVGVIFRDNSGAVVGGDLVEPTVGFTIYDEQRKQVTSEQAPPTPECSPGDRETWVVPHAGRVPAMADGRTDIYPMCDIQPVS